MSHTARHLMRFWNANHRRLINDFYRDLDHSFRFPAARVRDEFWKAKPTFRQIFDKESDVNVVFDEGKESPSTTNESIEINEKADGFKLKINLDGFKASDIQVEMQDKYLMVDAHTEKSECKDGLSTYFEKSFSRVYTMPKNVDLSALKSSLSDNGLLTIQGPISPSTSRTIPIQEAGNKEDSKN